MAFSWESGSTERGGCRWRALPSPRVCRGAPSRDQLGRQVDGLVGRARPAVGADRVGPRLGGRAAADDDLVAVAGPLVLERLDDVALADQRGREQRRDGDDVGVDLFGLVDELEQVDVDAKVPYVKAGGLIEELEDVLADRVQVALDRAKHDLALLGTLVAALLDLWLEHAHGRLEGQGSLHEFGQEDIFALELLADDVQAREQTLVDDGLRFDAGVEGRVHGGHDRVLVLVDDRLLKLLEELLVPHGRTPWSRRNGIYRPLAARSSCLLARAGVLACLHLRRLQGDGIAGDDAGKMVADGRVGGGVPDGRV